MHPRVRRRARRDPGRRGEAPDHRVPAQGAAVQLAARVAAARGRQVRRDGRVGAGAARRHPAVAQRRADAGGDRQRDRRAHRQGAGRGTRCGADRTRLPDRMQGGRGLHAQSSRARSSGCRTSARAARTTPAPRCPKARARRPASAATTWRSGWIAAPRPSRRWAARASRWIGQARVHRHAAHLREPRRRHLHALRVAGDPRGEGGRRQHHLQDPRQRRGGDDGRPAGRRLADGAADPAAGRGRGRRAPAPGERRARSSTRAWPGLPAGVAVQPSRRDGRAAARAAREAGRLGRSSTRRPAPPRSGAAARRRNSSIRPSASSSTRRSAKAAAIAACRATACRSCRWKRRSGRKRTIDQSSCNKDFSCVKGFCPSFVTVEGGALRKPAKAKATPPANLPSPTLPSLDQPCNVVVTGVGGTGVVTIGALMGMAAHLEGKGVLVLDMAGLAQKGGAVMSHVRLAATPAGLHAARVAARQADVVLGCDLMVGAGKEALGAMDAKRTCAVMNTDVAPTGAFTQDPDWQTSPEAMLQRVREAALVSESIDATSIATALMGDAVATNVFLLGYAWQRGWIPLGEAALLKAIEMNGAAVAMNQAAFAWGRQAALDLPAVRAAAGLEKRGCRRDDAAAHAVAGRADRRPHAAPDGLPERRLCPALRALRARDRGAGTAAHRRRPLRARSGGEPVQADGLQGRIRGRAAVRRDRLLRPRRAAVRRRLLRCASISRRRCWRSATPTAIWSSGPTAPGSPPPTSGWPRRSACAARRSTSSATRRSGAASARRSASSSR